MGRLAPFGLLFDNERFRYERVGDKRRCEAIVAKDGVGGEEVNPERDQETLYVQRSDPDPNDDALYVGDVDDQGTATKAE